MEVRSWAVGGAVALALAACMPDAEQAVEETTAIAELPVRLSEAEIEAAVSDAGCRSFDAPDGSGPAEHVEEDGPEAAELYDPRPPTAGGHLGRWVEARDHEVAPDERSVVHNHEHGAVSVWYLPASIAPEELVSLRRWAAARNAELANDAGAGVVLTPFDGSLEGEAVVAFRAWTGGLDCRSFDPVVADGFLLERFGDAPEGSLAPELDGVVVRATAT